MGEGIGEYVDTLRQGWDSLQRWAGFWGPVLPIAPPLQPFAVLGTLLALIATTGIALTALAVFLTSAFFLYLLLTQFFGIEISIGI
jgi:hypothetical protein